MKNNLLVTVCKNTTQVPKLEVPRKYKIHNFLPSFGYLGVMNINSKIKDSICCIYSLCEKLSCFSSSNNFQFDNCYKLLNSNSVRQIITIYNLALNKFILKQERQKDILNVIEFLQIGTDAVKMNHLIEYLLNLRSSHAWVCGKFYSRSRVISGRQKTCN